MFKILERYIGKTVLGATGLAALIITSLLLILSLLTEAKSVGEGDYGFVESLVYALMCLPNEIYQFSPLLILLGSIIALSILSSHRELAVMRASGFSILHIMGSVLFAAFSLIIVISVLGEYVGPALNYKAVIRKENAQNAGQAVVTSRGTWFHLDNNFIHVDSVVDRRLLNGITRYEFDNDHHLKSATFAKSMIFQDHQWLMRDVVQTRFYEERTQSQAFAEMPFDLPINTNLLKVGLIDPNEMSLPRLGKFSQYLEENGLQSSEYRYNFWQRIFQPLASLVMIFLAIPFVLGAMRNSSMGWRIIMGILTGFAFFVLNAMLGQLCIVYQLPPIFAALIPPLLFALIGIALSKRLIRY